MTFFIMLGNWSSHIWEFMGSPTVKYTISLFLKTLRKSMQFNTTKNSSPTQTAYGRRVYCLRGLIAALADKSLAIHKIRCILV